MLDRIHAGFTEQRRFMSDVGHELRTPLTILRGTLEMTDEHDPGDVREAHRIALDELDRMGRVVGDLSELAAATRPDYVTLRPLDMAAFARSAFARIEKIAEREWIFEGGADVTGDGDEQRLTQAVIQLAANAVRYSEPGTPIRFGVDQVAGPDGPEIHIRVQDEGVGIAPEDQRRIFERFSRIDPGRESGSGLGLPIVSAIAEGHGGVVRLASQPGHGSTFTLVIPQFTEPGGASTQHPADPQPPESRLSAPDPASPPPPRRTRGEAGVADPVPRGRARIARFVERGLRANAYACAVVEDGISALDLASSGDFDLLILDVGLPRMDGFQVLKALRSMDVEIPILMVTARTGVEDTVQGLEEGANDYIAKPFRFEELLARVKLRAREATSG